MAEIFSDLKNYLLEFKYPLANSMSDDQIADVFSASNRCFLVSWVTNLLNDACENTLKVENTEACLGNLLFEMSLCEKSQSIPFMRGELPLHIQLRIIQNMFKTLKSLSQPVRNGYVSHDDVENLQTLNLNIFPMYGEIKMLPPKVDSRKNSSDVSNNVEPEIRPDIAYEDLEELFQRVKEELPNITSNVKELQKQKNAEKKQTFDLNPKVLQKCDENLQIITQFFMNYNTIMDFKTSRPSDIKDANPNSIWQKIHKNIYGEYLEIVKYTNAKKMTP